MHRIKKLSMKPAMLSFRLLLPNPKEVKLEITDTFDQPEFEINPETNIRPGSSLISI